MGWILGGTGILATPLFVSAIDLYIAQNRFFGGQVSVTPRQQGP